MSTFGKDGRSRSSALQASKLRGGSKVYATSRHDASSGIVLGDMTIVAPLSANSRDRLDMLLPPDGTAFVLDEHGGYDAEINDFLNWYRTQHGVRPESLVNYANDIIPIKAFLVARGRTLSTVTAEDVADYKERRLNGSLSERLSDSSWNRAAITIVRVMQWAKKRRASTEEPLDFKVIRGKQRAAEDQVRMIDIQSYLIFRNIGLLGGGEDNEKAMGSRAPLRNAAFAELVVTSGLRMQEANALLDVDLPKPGAFKGRFEKSMLPGAITKRRVTRRIPISKRVVVEYLAPYRREERTAFAARWKEDPEGRMRAVGMDPATLLRVLETDGVNAVVEIEGKRKTVPLSSFNWKERRRMVVALDLADMSAGEFAAFFLSEGGTGMDKETWNRVFNRANERCRAYGYNIAVAPHMLRHTFAVYHLSNLLRAEIGAITRMNLRGNTDRTADLYRRILGDPLRNLQKILGHKSVQSTMKYLTYIDEAIEIVEEATANWDRILGNTEDVLAE